MIVYNLIEPSLNGTSTWLQWLGCPRKAQWDIDRRRKGITGVGSEAMQIGTLVHAYMDLYHSQQITLATIDEVEFQAWGGVALGQWHNGDPIEPHVIDEAKRVSSAWMQDHSWDYFGKYVKTELTFPDVGMHGPAVMAEHIQQVVTGNMQRSWSGRVDLMASVDGEEWEVVDWKTESRVMASTRVKHQMDLKTKTYMLAAACAGYTVKQARVVMLVKTKVPYFDEVVIPFPSRREITMIHGMFDYADRVRKERGAEVNVGECFGAYGDVCKYLTDGSCNRIGG